MSNSSQPQGLQPTRLLRPWDSPGKSTGVGCHRLLQCHCLVAPYSHTCTDLYIPTHPHLYTHIPSVCTSTSIPVHPQSKTHPPCMHTHTHTQAQSNTSTLSNYIQKIKPSYRYTHSNTSPGQHDHAHTFQHRQQVFRCTLASRHTHNHNCVLDALVPEATGSLNLLIPLHPQQQTQLTCVLPGTTLGRSRAVLQPRTSAWHCQCDVAT